MSIKKISVKKIFDSRGEETIEVGLLDQSSNHFFAQIPSGKSRGKNEATVLGFVDAQNIVKYTLDKEVVGKKFNSIRELDEFLISLDGTKNKSRIGGNLMLGVSIAFARMLAFGAKKELWEVLNEEFFMGKIEDKSPLIFSNLVNGGAHANNNLDIQEYLVVAKKSDSFSKSVEKLTSLYKNLGKFLKAKNKIKNIPIGDEGGYAVNFKNNFEPISILEKMIFRAKYEKEFSLGLDVAASGFYKSNKYNFDGRKLTNDKLKGMYLDYFKKSRLLFSIEDPFSEGDLAGFKQLNSVSKDKIIVGDDLTVTNHFLVGRYAAENLISGVIIKPNQIGTITETCEAMLVAKDNNVRTIVSHRSGETADNFIIHLAKAGNADGVKIGAPIRERIYKFNELIRLYD